MRTRTHLEVNQSLGRLNHHALDGRLDSVGSKHVELLLEVGEAVKLSVSLTRYQLIRDGVQKTRNEKRRTKNLQDNFWPTVVFSNATRS